MDNLLDTYTLDLECNYKGERYSVRDNGAVLKHPNNKRTRPTDNKWTFGKQNSRNGYMFIASVRIHQIVATAFHGVPPTKEYVVDHIDTNRANNRPENLRWVTRMENVLINPITVKRIESICNCNIEDFVTSPQKYTHLLSNAPTDIQWMRTVSSEQAEECLRNLTNWAKSDKALKGKSFGELISHRNRIYS